VPNNNETVNAPAWVKETPAGTGYFLAITGEDDTRLHHIDITREEYIALIAALAKMRGYQEEEEKGEEGTTETEVLSDEALLHGYADQLKGADSARLRAMIADGLEDASHGHLQFIARCVDIAKNNACSSTPAEELISMLVLGHYVHGLTPEMVADDVDNFNDQYGDVTLAIERRAKMYKSLAK
jgi:hypothetical protein